MVLAFFATVKGTVCISYLTNKGGWIGSRTVHGSKDSDALGENVSRTGGVFKPTPGCFVTPHDVAGHVIYGIVVGLEL